MAWLREHGLIGSYDDYVSLPVAVLQDARMWEEADAADDHKRAAAEARAAKGLRHGRGR